MQWRRLVCLVAAHHWTPRWDDRQCERLHVCVRCGKVRDRPDGFTRLLDMPGAPPGSFG